MRPGKALWRHAYAIIMINSGLGGGGGDIVDFWGEQPGNTDILVHASSQ